MVNIYKDELTKVVNKWYLISDKENAEFLYEFIIKDLIPLHENLIKEVRLNLYELSREKSIIYINEVISDHNQIHLKRIHHKELIRDYYDGRISMPFPEVSDIDLGEEFEDILGTPTKNEGRREISVSDGVFIHLHIYKESFLLKLDTICKDFNLPFQLFYNEREPYLMEIEAEDGVNIDLNENKVLDRNISKLKWKGTPSQFGFIIDLLIQGGYIEKPTSSFPKDANFYLQFIDINTTITTLTKELSESTNSLAPKNRTKIIIPHKDKLD